MERRIGTWLRAAAVCALAAADFGRPGLPQARADDLAAIQQIVPRPGGFAAISQSGDGNRASVEQKYVASGGPDIANRAVLSQTGNGNSAAVQQEGSGNSALQEQSGNDNASIIDQYGSGHVAEHTQIGSGNAAAIVQFGPAGGGGVTVTQFSISGGRH